MKALNPGSGGEIPAIWHGTGACHGHIYPKIRILKAQYYWCYHYILSVDRSINIRMHDQTVCTYFSQLYYPFNMRHGYRFQAYNMAVYDLKSQYPCTHDIGLASHMCFMRVTQWVRACWRLAILLSRLNIKCFGKNKRRATLPKSDMAL